VEFKRAELVIALTAQVLVAGAIYGAIRTDLNWLIKSQDKIEIKVEELYRFYYNNKVSGNPTLRNTP